MGTKGLYSFLFKGKYYTIYNNWDSYPSGLGFTLCKLLSVLNLDSLCSFMEKAIIIEDTNTRTLDKKFAESFCTIIQNDSSYFEKWLNCNSGYVGYSDNDLVEDLIREGADKFYDYISSHFHTEADKWKFLLENLFSNEILSLEKVIELGHLFLVSTPGNLPPCMDSHIEWVYIIDLDNERFIIKLGGDYCWSIDIRDISQIENLEQFLMLFRPCT